MVFVLTVRRNRRNRLTHSGNSSFRCESTWHQPNPARRLNMAMLTRVSQGRPGNYARSPSVRKCGSSNTVRPMILGRFNWENIPVLRQWSCSPMSGLCCCSPTSAPNPTATTSSWWISPTTCPSATTLWPLPPHQMRAGFDAGYALGRQADPWQEAPPNLGDYPEWGLKMMFENK